MNLQNIRSKSNEFYSRTELSNSIPKTNVNGNTNGSHQTETSDSHERRIEDEANGGSWREAIVLSE